MIRIICWGCFFCESLIVIKKISSKKKYGILFLSLSKMKARSANSAIYSLKELFFSIGRDMVIWLKKNGQTALQTIFIKNMDGMIKITHILQVIPQALRFCLFYTQW